MRYRFRNSLVAVCASALVVPLLAGVSPALAAGTGESPMVLRARPHRIETDLRTLPHVREKPRQRPEFEPPPSQKTGTEAAPTAAPTTLAPAVSAPAPIATYPGLDFANWGAGWPPDPNADVGPDYLVESVNTSIGIFRKSDGTQVAAFTFNTFLGGVDSTPCGTGGNGGDPVVVYDSVKDRWIISDFAWANVTQGPFYECMAVSQTGDPVAGGWNIYDWQVEPFANTNANFPDYPKLGVWWDTNGGTSTQYGLYMSANVFRADGRMGFKAPQFWAFNLQQMEAGQTANGLTGGLASPGAASGANFGFLPANSRLQADLPPGGRHEFFVAESNTAFNYRVYQTTVDWTNLTFTVSSVVTVGQTTYMCCPSTVPAGSGLSSSANSLDTLSDRVMMQAQYQDLAGVESLWVDHTTGTSGSAAIAQLQWAQISVSGGTVTTTAAQQGFFHPASPADQFMPSAAVDSLGDMAIGYSASDANNFASIYYAGRLVGDAAGTLGQTQQTGFLGTGYQCCNFSVTAANHRWGDYSSMTLDPDGCTFWYTNEYYDSSPAKLADDNWKTRFVELRFSSCTPNTLATDIASVSGSGTYNGTGTLTATLRSTTTGEGGVGGKTIAFSVDGNSAGTAVTNSSGVATLSAVSLSGIDAGTYPAGVVASFAGDAAWATSNGSGTLTVAKADQTITFGSIPDHTFGDPDFTVSASASSGLDVSFTAAGPCTIVNGNQVHLTGTGTCTVTAHQAGDSNYNAAPDVPQSFAISGPLFFTVTDIDVLEGDSGTTTAPFQVALSANPASTVSVQVATANSTATAGQDYVAVPPTTLTWNPGDPLTQTVNVTIKGDTRREGNESFLLKLSNPLGATIADTQGTGTIIDSEGRYFLSVGNTSVTEGDSGTTTMSFPVNLSVSPGTGESVSVKVATANGTATAGSDYTAVPLTTLTWNAGDPVTKIVNVTVTGDTTVEPNETVLLNLSGNSKNAFISDKQGMGTIVNDDGTPGTPPPPDVSVSDVDVLEGNAGTSSAAFSVTLSQDPAAAVSVNVATANSSATAGSDYVAVPLTTLTWNPGDPLTKTVNVTIKGDTLMEGNETFLVNLSSPSGVTLADPQGLGTIIDEEGRFFIYVGDAIVTEGNSGTTTMAFTVSVSAPPATGQTIFVKVATADGTATAGSDYVAVPLTTLTWNPGDPLTKTVNVTVNGDTTVEPNETVLLNLSGNSKNAVISDNQGVGTIVNDD